MRIAQAAVGAALGSACLLLAACGSTNTQTFSAPQSARIVAPAASVTTPSGPSREAGAFATRVQTERVYVPATAWKSLDPEQSRRIERRRFVRCEGERFVHTNVQQAQVEATAVRPASFAHLGTRHSRNGWLVILRVTSGFNEGTPRAFLEHGRIPMRVERLAGKWRWLLDSSDIHEYVRLAAVGGSGCPE